MSHRDELATRSRWISPALAHRVRGPVLHRPAPSLRLPDIRGRLVELAEVLRSRAALLVFFHGSWCRDCTDLLSELSALHSAFESEETEILAISNEHVLGSRAALGRLRLAFDVLVDAQSDVVRRYDLLQGWGGFSLWQRGQRIDTTARIVFVERDGWVGWTGPAHPRPALGAAHILAAARHVRAHSVGWR